MFLHMIFAHVLFRYLQDSQKSDKNSEKVVIQNGDSSSYFSSEITISQKERVLFNPLKVFKLIRNLAITLPSLEKDLQRDEERRECMRAFYLFIYRGN